MKIRNGFVSNSSSSSFVVLLPEDYKLDEKSIETSIADESLWINEECEASSVVKAFKMLLASKSLWQDECRVGEFDVLVDLLKDYVIAGTEGGPDEGKIILADKDKIKKIMEK